MSITIAVPRENNHGELRVAITPNLINKLNKMGLEVIIQQNAGFGIHAKDSSYNDVTIADNTLSLYGNSDIILKVQPPSEKEIEQFKNGSVLISFLYPHLNISMVKKLLDKKITSIAMELIPRISRAQDMDVLSSQATIIGYKAVLIAAYNSKFFFPMLTTAAGSIRPAKVFVIGIGVAGLQAIATAKRLGAQVSAYDVRPDTKEQAESLGAKFIDISEIKAVGDGGYARELSVEEKSIQTNAITKHIATCDVIITTAGVPGKLAPKILSEEMIKSMKPGSIIVDTLADTGGNCEITKPGESIIYNDITVIGPINIASSMSINASEMYARNIINILNLIINDKEINLDWKDEIITGSIVTHNGIITNEYIKKLVEGTI